MHREHCEGADLPRSAVAELVTLPAIWVDEPFANSATTVPQMLQTTFHEQ